MQIIEKVIEYHSRSDIVKITPIGDTHIGNIATNEAVIKSAVAKVNSDPLHFTVGTGDYCDYIARTDKRFDAETIPEWLQPWFWKNDLITGQNERFLKLVEPLKGQWLGALSGGHDTKIAKYYERNIYSEVLRGIKESQDEKLRLGKAGFVRLKMRRMSSEGKRLGTWTVVIYAQHEGPSSSKSGAKALFLESLIGAYDADIFLVGHGHARVSLKKERTGIARQGFKIVKREWLAAMCGSALGSVSDPGKGQPYFEGTKMFPLGAGFIEIHLIPATQEIKCII